MNYFLKGLPVVAVIAACVALLYFAIALIGVLCVVRAVLALGIIVGGVTPCFYVPYLMWKSISRKHKN